MTIERALRRTKTLFWLGMCAMVAGLALGLFVSEEYLDMGITLGLTAWVFSARWAGWVAGYRAGDLVAKKR